MAKRLSLTTRVTLLFVLSAAALLTGVGILAYLSGRASLQQATIAELQATARDKEDAVTRWEQERTADVAALAAIPAFIDRVSSAVSLSAGSSEFQAAHDNVQRDMRGWASQRKEILAVMLIDPQTGQVLVADSSTDEGKFREDRPYFINGLKAPYFQNPYYSTTIQAIAMAASAPIRGANGKTLAVLVTRLSPDAVSSIVNQRTSLHNSDEVFLISPTGLYASQPRFISDPAILRLGNDSNTVRHCLAGNNGVAFENNYRGQPAIKVYRWLPQQQLCLVAQIDQGEAFAPIDSFGQTLVLIGGVSLLVAFGLAYWLARSITKPVLALTAGAVQFGEGDLDVRLPETSSDELGVLARAFNAMAVSIATKETQLSLRAEQLEQANKELESFSYSISHDLRAPLRSMDGFARLLIDNYADQVPDEAKHYLERIRANAQKMGHLIDDLLAFSRLNRAPLNLGAAQPATLVQQVIEDLKDEQTGRKVKITIGNLPECHADPALLKQVWANLIDNALKYTRKRDHAYIEIGVMDRDGESVYFIKDNGAGFDMQYSDKLFGVFQRLHRAAEFEGTGVGLATVQRIIHRHGGRVWAEAVVDKGATFYFTLGETNHE